MIQQVVITTPNNPSGKVWSRTDIERVVSICKKAGSWLVVDQTYCEFTYDGSRHFYPCSKELGYNRIIHVFSFSKNFGMPGDERRMPGIHRINRYTSFIFCFCNI